MHEVDAGVDSAQQHRRLGYQDAAERDAGDLVPHAAEHHSRQAVDCQRFRGGVQVFGQRPGGRA